MRHGVWRVGAVTPAGPHCDHSKACGQHLAVTCTIHGSSAKDAVTTEHSIVVGHTGVANHVVCESHVNVIDLIELRGSRKGFVGRDGKVRIELRVRSTRLDM